ncbi:large subunit ribosomal protein L10 [Hydrocarboniphaga daqingensis]|jgi:large subunit ribosomal protein L10|uniref:Large ribosomal subunit protein uL10 n=1 Tax=Hydrocarboniphaga daqingensis TaxID=490188 RepID=A0A1M5SC34_9GAMM|nr:50S ribosomal protein L10 [Hydrocarboniphaga daqingensis]SHH35848.1 large subunit ribosomal protein L10 [Hydrocarboniphaga daqingensis]
MALRLEDKKVLVAEVNEVASRALSAVVAEYRGLTAGKFDVLRAEARKNGIYLHVVKNTLAKRAVKGTEFECLDPVLVGPLVIGFSLDDPGAVGRVIKDFAKANEKLVVKGIAVGGNLYGSADIDRLANLPTKDQALSMLLGVMKAPITQFVRTVAEPTAQFVRAVKAVGDKMAESA